MNTPAIVSAIVPARNEAATIAGAVRSLAAQPEIAEILVVNDDSTDATGEILAQLAGEIPRLRALNAGSLPAGWVGKNHACAEGARQARGEWLLFTDADTEHLPGSTAHALGDAARTGAALVSYSPGQVTATFWERALIPFIYCRLAARYSYARVNDPAQPDAAANGQYLLIRRDAYDAVGGHAAVRGEVLEDVALARRAKQAGYRLWFAPGAGVVRTRMYRSFAEMWQGWAKNLYPLLGGAAARELLRVVAWIPLLLLFIGLALRGMAGGVLLVVAAALLAVRHAAYAAQLRANRYPRRDVVYYLPAVALYAAVLLASARRYRRGRVAWKGREYPVRTP